MREGDGFERYLVAEVYEEDDDGGTYAVFDTVDGRRQVLKVRLPEAPPEIVDALKREYRIQHGLRHPNLAHATRLLELGDGTVGMVLDHASGGALASWLTGGPVAPGMRRTVLTGLLRGLIVAHDAGFVHRDLKPENLLIATGPTGPSVQVADFGMAKDIAEAGWVEASGLSAHFRFLGTPGYMAPEQFQRPASVDRRADLYSVGCILYEMLTGTLPVDPDGRDYPKRLVCGEWARPDVSSEMLALLEDLLAPRRDERPPDSQTVLQRLREAGELR